MSETLRLEWRTAEELEDNPANWKTHPDGQMVALEKLIAGDVGWAGAALYNEQTGRLIDGHARKGVARKRGLRIPVLVGSWTEEQERVILATLDPVGQMYETVSEQYEALRAGMDAAYAEMTGALKRPRRMWTPSRASMRRQPCARSGV